MRIRGLQALGILFVLSLLGLLLIIAASVATAPPTKPTSQPVPDWLSAACGQKVVVSTDQNGGRDLQKSEEIVVVSSDGRTQFFKSWADYIKQRQNGAVDNVMIIQKGSCHGQ